MSDDADARVERHADILRSLTAMVVKMAGKEVPHGTHVG